MGNAIGNTSFAADPRQHFAHSLQMRFFDAFNNAKDENAKAGSDLPKKFHAQTAACDLSPVASPALVDEHIIFRHRKHEKKRDRCFPINFSHSQTWFKGKLKPETSYRMGVRSRFQLQIFPVATPKKMQNWQTSPTPKSF
jgi:hypothetical protein